MTEILSREKELFKMNQELNQMSLSPTHRDGNRLGQGVTQSRYSTYLKQKGPSTLLRKKHAVDMTSVKACMARGGLRSRGICKSPPKSPPTSPFCQSLASPRLGKGGMTLLSQSAKGTKPLATDRRHWDGDADLKPVNKMQGKQPPGRIDNGCHHRVSHKTATYVKYHNPNFKQSPSLDMLLQQEADNEATQHKHHQQQQQTQQQQQPQQHHQHVGDVEPMRPSTTVINGQSKKQLTQENFIRYSMRSIKYASNFITFFLTQIPES